MAEVKKKKPSSITSGRFSSITPNVIKRGTAEEKKPMKKANSKYGWSRPDKASRDKDAEERAKARLTKSSTSLRPVPNGSNFSRGTGYHCIPARTTKKRVAADPAVYRPYSRTPNVPELSLLKGPKEVYRSPSGTFVSPRQVSPMLNTISSPRMHSPHPRDSSSSAPVETPKSSNRMFYDFDYIEAERERVRQEMLKEFELEKERWADRGREASPTATDVSVQEKHALEELLEVEKAKIREELEDEFKKSKEMWIMGNTPSPSPQRAPQDDKEKWEKRLEEEKEAMRKELEEVKEKIRLEVEDELKKSMEMQVVTPSQSPQRGPTEEEFKRDREKWMKEVLEEERAALREQFEKDFGKEKQVWMSEMQREVTEQWDTIGKQIKIKDTMINDLQSRLEEATGKQAYKTSDQHKRVEDYIKHDLNYEKQTDLLKLDGELDELLSTDEAGEA